MQQKVIKHKILHTDDVSLTLEYPDYIHDLTHLSEQHIKNDFELFARILFDNILTKNKRNFQIVYNEESDSWDYLVPVE